MIFLLLAACQETGGKDSEAAGPAPEPPPLVINEFLAMSEAIYADEEGEFDNWVEIYNAGDEIVSFDGLYLTDDDETPTKWALPAGDGIDAGGYALFWADGDVDQGENHMSFKLSGSGEYLGIFYIEDGSDPVAVDPIEFQDQAVDQSMARVPDGSLNWESTTEPTPGETNGGG